MRSSQPFNDFLEAASGREVALAIAKNEDELKEFTQSMNELGFKEAGKTLDLLSYLKSYMVAKDDTAKNIYDFAVQYPTGQVEIFDKDKMQSETFSPGYTNSAVFLIDEKVLNKLSAEGFDLLSVAGPAYRS
jgi:hypothetical protein